MRKPGPPLELTPEDERDIERVLLDMIERDESVAAQVQLLMQSVVAFGCGVMIDGNFVPLSEVRK